jgi:seryl-tRNA synthetase
MTPAAASAVTSAFRDAVVESGHLVPLGPDGLYARSRGFERVVEAVQAAVRGGFGDPAPTQLALPWVMPASLLVDSDYIRSFPDLIGSVFGFDGDDRQHARLLTTLEEGGPWTDALAVTDLALCPAGCHPLYPLLTARVLSSRLRMDAVGHCFRQEPSLDPGRMRSFRQHEQVCVGTPADAEDHRLAWLDRAQAFFAELGLVVEREIANDPFFGRAGRVLANGQRAQGLKEELLADVGGRRTAIASGNNHLDHFAVPFDITMADGSRAHTSCIGFGLERVVLALLSRHGLDIDGWPASVRGSLWP